MRFECSVCYETIQISQVDGSDICTIKCGHVFHQHCLKDWMERSSTCPECRANAAVGDIQLLFFNVASGDTSATYHNESLSVALFEKDEMRVLKETLEDQGQELQTIRDLNSDLLQENDKMMDSVKEMTARITLLENKVKELENSARVKVQDCTSAIIGEYDY